MDHPRTGPYPFPTESQHDAPSVQPTRPVEHAPDEGAIDHGIEESFPASDPVSVNVTKAEPVAARANRPASASAARTASPSWNAVVRTGLVAGACASVASTAVLAWRGRSDVGSYVAPTNAVSHVFWTQEALRARRPSMRHTLVGYAIHHASATFWALLYAWLKARRPNASGWAAGLAGAGATAAAACAIDYTITPQRLRPGFEHHLSRKSMTYVYAALAIGLALGCAMTNKEEGQRK